MPTIRVILFAVLILAFPLAGIAAGSRSDYETAYKNAMQAHEQAEAASNEWTTTTDTLKAAQKAAKQGDYTQAKTLADRAQALAKLAVAQAQHQHKNWRKAVVE